MGLILWFTAKEEINLEKSINALSFLAYSRGVRGLSSYPLLPLHVNFDFMLQAT